MSDNILPSPSETPGPRVFLIPDANLSTFRDKLAKLSKRAAKLGLVPPSYTVIKEAITTVRVEVDRIEDENGAERPIFEDRIVVIHHITLSSSVVVLAGWEFCASVEHTEEGNILHTLKGKTVPAIYRDCEKNCDHCNIKRYRKETFIVRHCESGEYKQVGRTCLKDFLGVDGERYAAIAELYYECDELGEASESGGSGGHYSKFDYLDVYLGYVAEVIALEGWRSNSVAKDFGGKPSTSTIAYNTLHPMKGMKRSELLFQTPTAKSIETARLAIEWCNAITDNETEGNDYLHNIRVIARRGIVGAKQYGYAASIVSGYQRAMGELVKKARRASWEESSKYVGEVGDKVAVSILVEAAIGLDGAYGSTTLHIMSDKEGNIFKWNSSSAVLEKGKEYTLRGTVKRHEEYKGVKQTTLTHCSEVILQAYTITTKGGEVSEVMAEDEKDARSTYLLSIGAKRMVKGTVIERKAIIRDMPLEGGSVAYTVDEKSLASFIVAFGESVRYFLYHCRSLPTFCDL